MTDKMVASTHQGMTRSSSHPPSMYVKDFHELVMENGQILVQGSLSNGTHNNPSRIKYDPTHMIEATGITKRTRLNTLCSLLNDQFPPRKDSDLSSSHSLQITNDQDDLQFSQNSKSSNKLEEEFANIKQAKQSPLKKRTDSSQAPGANSKKLKYLGECDQRTAKVNNFSNFLVPNVFPKSTQPIGNGSLEKLEEIEAAKGSKGLKGFRDQQTTLHANKSNNKVSLVARSDEEPPLDENSEAVDHNIATLKGKGKANSSVCDEPLLPSSSVCSLGASNNPNSCIRKHEDTDESTYSTDNDEEAEDVEVKETPAPEGNSVKRSRSLEIQNLYEKKRRDEMNKKMRTLKELIPNCNKVDKASLLDDAIDYLKNLKLQLQIMSMGSGLCMPQMMLPQLMGAGMGFGSSTGINPWTPPQVPIPPLYGIKDNSTLHNLFGTFSNQMPHIPIPNAPNFTPTMMIGNSSTQQLMPTTTPNNMAKHLANPNSQVTTLDVSDLHAKADLCGTNQAENQVSLNHIPSYPFYFSH